MRSLPKSKIDAMEVALGDLETRMETLKASHKKLNSRVAMSLARDVAAKQKLNGDQEPETENPEAERDELKRMLVSHIRT